MMPMEVLHENERLGQFARILNRISQVLSNDVQM